MGLSDDELPLESFFEHPISELDLSCESNMIFIFTLLFCIYTYCIQNVFFPYVCYIK